VWVGLGKLLLREREKKYFWGVSVGKKSSHYDVCKSPLVNRKKGI